VSSAATHEPAPCACCGQRHSVKAVRVEHVATGQRRNLRLCATCRTSPPPTDDGDFRAWRLTWTPIWPDQLT
jgi:hypothetical protein